MNVRDAFRGMLSPEVADALADIVENSGNVLHGAALAGIQGEATYTSGALALTKRVALLNIDGTKAFTLADSTLVGQRLSVRCIAAANTPAGTLTPTSLQDGTAIAFDAVSDFAELEWTGAKWRIIGSAGIAIS